MNRAPSAIERTGAAGQGRRAWLSLAFGIALAALAIRVHGLGSASLWGDEAHTVRRAESLREVVIERRLEPLYAMARAAFVLGKDEWAVRLPHAVIGAASVVLIYLAGEAFACRRIGIIAALLLAASPFHVFHSREARHYSLMVFLSLLSMLLVKKAVDTRRKSWMAGFAAAGLAGFHNHAFAAIPFAAQALWGSIALWRGAPAGARAASARRTVPALLAALACAGLALYLLNPSLWEAARKWIGGGQERRFEVDLGGDALETLLPWLGAGPGFPAVLHLALFAVGLASLAARRLPAFGIILSTAVTTAAALEAIEWVGPTHPFRVRYVIFLLPCWLIGVAAGICAVADLIRKGARRLVTDRAIPAPEPGTTTAAALPLLLALACVVPAVLPGLRNVLAYRSADYRGAVDHLGRHEGPDALARPSGPEVSPDTVICFLPYRPERHFAALLWYLSRRKPGLEKTPIIVRTPGEIDALLAAGTPIVLVDFDPPDLDAAEAVPGLQEAVREHFIEAARMAPGLWSPRLGAPAPEEQIVIRVSRLQPR